MNGIKENMFKDIFKNKIPNFDKLHAHGFSPANGRYTFAADILKGQFRLNISVELNGAVSGEVIDTDTGDPYVLYLNTNATGTFIGKVRTECSAVFQKIADSCFDTQIFKSPVTHEVITYIRTKYQNEFEFLWPKFPDNAIVRRQDNKKWYAAVLTVKRNKIGLEGEENIEIIDLRMSTAEIAAIVDHQKYFPGYHMNKQHWITLRLDGSVPANEIFSLIDKSYLLAKK